MGNWLANRCDNPSETITLSVDIDVTTGSTVSVNNGSEIICVTLVETYTAETKTTYINVYENCLNCLNNINQSMLFKPCFDGNELIIDSSSLNFVPTNNEINDLNLTITGVKGGNTININDCYTYLGYTNVKPSGSIIINNKPETYLNCEKCNPYKAEKINWNKNTEGKFKDVKSNYSKLFD